MEFRILGPLAVVAENGSGLPLRGRTQRALLGILLLHRNDVVAVDRLVEELWGSSPPDTALRIVRNAVSQLRKLLPVDRLETRAPGYLLRVEPGELDAERFEQLVEAGREAAREGDPARAASTLREAVGLWRGVALADFVYEPFAETAIGRLEELRLTAIEDRIDADIALGRSADVVSELEELVARHPLRERPRGHLMLALYRAGRQAEALDVYQQTRRLLDEELGIEPSTELQRLERAILMHEPELEGPATAATPAPVVAPAPPRQVRKLVTLLFAELESPGADTDPERLSGLLEEGRATATQILERFGATVEDIATGGVMAVFGLPVVHEDDALRAARAAFELQRRVGSALTLRVGIASGEALVGGAGRAVVGDVVAGAARLARDAPAGRVLVAAATERLIRPGAELASADGGAFRLLDIAEDAEAIPRRFDTALLGRERELQALRHALDRAVLERTAYLFTVLGPAGIGKSRLAYELATAVSPDALVLRGGCLPYGDGITLWPLVEIVRTLAPGDVRRSLAERLAGEDEAQLVADRVAGAVGSHDRPTESDELFWAVRRMLEAVARERPLVVVLEDLHWGEATFLDLVEHIADWANDAPMLLLCLSRPELVETRPSWGGGKLNATTLLLEPLSRDDAETLIDNLPGAEQLDAVTRVRIAETAEGNPLYLEQMLALVAEQGGAETVPVPPSIQALLAARLDRLDPAERALIERAALVGNEFWRDAVEELSPPEERAGVRARLQQLSRRDLVRPSRSVFPGDDAFRFRHMLIRDVAYDSLPKAARSELHERFAAWVDAHAAGRETEVEEIVGYHLEQAHRYGAELGREDPRVAAHASDRLARAGRRAYARGDIPATTSLLSRAAALAATGTRERAELLVDLGDALRESGDFRLAEATLADAREAAEETGDPTLGAHAVVIGLRLRLQVDPTISTEELEREANRAVEIFTEHDDRYGLAKAWELLAWSLWFRCRAAGAAAALELAVANARVAGDGRTEAQSVNLLLGAAFFGPTPVEEAIELCRRTIAETDQQRIIASALRALSGLEAMRGNFDEARALVARYRAILEDLGLAVTAATASETSAIVELLADEPAAAERDLRRGFNSLERMGETFNQPNLAAMLAHALHAQRRPAEALQYAEISERTTGAEDLFTQAQWRSARAKILAGLGRAEEAEELARAAVAAAETTDFLVLQADSRVDLAAVLVAAGREAEAADALREAVALYDRKGNTVAARRASNSLLALG